MSSLVFITAKDQDEAKKIQSHLLENKLAACVTIIPTVSSSYWWEGKIEQATEVQLIVKTVSQKVPMLIEEVKKVHSYTVPEIVSVPIENGNPDYLNWIKKSVNL